VTIGVSVLALVLAACNGDDTEATTGPAPTTGPVPTTAVSGDVVFGSGSIPEGFPSDFPIPQAATVGSTLVDSNRGLYEVILFIPAEQEAAIVFFEGNLESAGYTVTADGFDGDTWRIEFEREGEQGRILLKLEDTGITSAAVDLTID
jgi:hypothetical protein